MYFWCVIWTKEKSFKWRGVWKIGNSLYSGIICLFIFLLFITILSSFPASTQLYQRYAVYACWTVRHAPYSLFFPSSSLSFLRKISYRQASSPAGRHFVLRNKKYTRPLLKHRIFSNLLQVNVQFEHVNAQVSPTFHLQIQDGLFGLVD
jgi:hypothetical protein